MKDKAVALRYNEQKENAPRVIGKGQGQVAQNIIRLAQKNNIPIKEDPDLVEMLSKVDIDKEIPSNLYKAVAEVFAFIYKHTRK